MINFAIFDVGLIFMAMDKSHQMLDTFAIYQNIHFIGIGGTGISALARLLHHRGHRITGTDQTTSHNLDLLRAIGIEISLGHRAESLPPTTELVIHTTAIDSGNPELAEASHRNIPILAYPQAIGKLTLQHETISICGTHGKTTITALLGHLLSHCDRNPTVIVGGLIPDFGNSNFLPGTPNGLLVLESCEYQEAFLDYSPHLILLNNIDPDHLDYYGTEENYLLAFDKFIGKLPLDGVLIANSDDKNIRALLARQKFKGKTVLFGRQSHNDVILKNNQVWINGEHFLSLQLRIPGEHNLLNATGAVALCHHLGLTSEQLAAPLQSFQGAARRLEFKGRLKSTLLYDDYGHSPAEIRATLAALKTKHGTNSKILCVFQPHQYSRTKLLFEQFCGSFADAACVFVPNIFRSRDSEEDVLSVSIDQLVDGINSLQPGVAFNTQNFEQTAQKIQSCHQKYDIVITMGAGDVNRIGEMLLNNFKTPSAQS